jgi:hypothetical protein
MSFDWQTQSNFVYKIMHMKFRDALVVLILLSLTFNVYGQGKKVKSKKADKDSTQKVWGPWSKAASARTYPVNKGSALRFRGNDKLFSNPSILPIFYGSGNYWDSDTTRILTESFL